MTLSELDALHDLFEAQYPGLPVGNFCNPEAVCEDDGTIEFRCHYDNYDNEEDEWTWYFDKRTRRFYN